MIDEIQYAPELLPYIKIQVDRSRKKGDFWIAGSQAFHLTKNVSESLAGRVGIVNLLGLSDAEIFGEPSEPFRVDRDFLLKRLSVRKPRNLNDVYRRIFTGSMPSLYADEGYDWEKYYYSYVNTYLERDVRELAQVGDIMEFYDFMTVVAAYTSKPVVYEQLAVNAGISAVTAKKWLSILVASNIVALVQPYHSNVLTRVVKMPLLHFLDTGLAAYLLRWSSPETLEKGLMSSAFFETFVFSEIYKSYINAGKEPPIYYYRDRDQKEIDLLLFQDCIINPIEIKKSVSPGRNAIKNFGVLDPIEKTFSGLESLRVHIGTGAVVCLAEDVLPIDQNNYYVPAWLI